jgi:hypothetical protein
LSHEEEEKTLMASVTFQGRTYQIGEAVPFQPIPLPDWLPITLPAGWEELEQPLRHLWGHIDRGYGRVYQKHGGSLRVILSCMRYGDGKAWLHVSISRKNRELPTWPAMCEVKDLFIGPERTALQVHPPRANYVNIHEACLHLWHCLDGDVTPDFTLGGSTM